MRSRGQSIREFWIARRSIWVGLILFVLGSLPSFPESIKSIFHLSQQPAWVIGVTGFIFDHLWQIGLGLVVLLLFEEYHKQRMNALTTRAALDAERDDRGSIDLVYPWIRGAFVLENYDNSSEKGDNRDRTLRPPIPSMRLQYARYSSDNPIPFNFGVRNDNRKAPITAVLLRIYFPTDDGMRVQIKRGNWVCNTDNYEYAFMFQLVHAQRAMNGDDPLFAVFPHPGNYVIRIAINALGLGEKIYQLPVTLE